MEVSGGGRVLFCAGQTSVDGNGKPLTIEEDDIGPDGKPKVDELGIVQKKTTDVVENGKPITRT
jgi:hypothetical protein